MSKVVQVAKACIPGEGKSGKAHYVTIGRVIEDEDGTRSIKLDCLPLPSSNWKGWINLYDYEPRTN